ncbi:methionine--tRNA ligase [Rhodohalobacter sp. SW132]|uniref:methionine--tRNA ligase n=1 Tax=Rhodohalobacter sp. SW132 TaxID=2293433 RepID=UPI000E23B584|nr:methionine--tRNA ligase [Rhodohalobacter sp. SW132]REL38087.1 methionine--tRNA ligase [Rhodohalobacter sp. SW132]
MSKRTLITSALPYANGPIHLGHLAGAYLPADLYTRYLRLRGRDVLHICGSDEHGVPITIAAEKEGITPQQVVDKFHTMNKQVFEQFGIDFDYYGRTSSATHKETSQAFFKTLHDQGLFKKKTEEQLYDDDASMFLPDRYVKGECPKCGHPEAYGDQCEKCGSSLSPTELINPISAISGKTPILKKTEHWYLPLGDFQQKLEKWVDSRENWKANVAGQCKSWLKSGLEDRAVTRDLTWGVPVPLPDAAGKVLYVWFDAPIGYISATKEWAEKRGEPDLWKTYWQDEETDLIHFIGKDNIVFHCIMFPAMLMQHGDYVLPKNVPANEFLNLEGRKLSTSKGWAVWLDEYMEEFEPDLLRYVLGTTLPETKDSDFSWKDFQARINGELADILGNFVFRATSFTQRFFDGAVPKPESLSEADKKALHEIDVQKKQIETAYDNFRFREAIAETMNLARAGNRYFTETEPWKTRKEAPQKCANTLYVCAQICGALSLLFHPVMPRKMNLLREQLGIPANTTWDQINDHLVPAGYLLSDEPILFNKIEDDVVDREIEKLKKKAAEAKTEESSYPPLKETATFDDFMSLDLRAGKILKAEKVKKSKKLLKITVDVGFEKRTILSGISEFFEPDEITGQTVVVVANLAPKKMMGIESNGMILMGENSDGVLHFVSTSAEPGSPVT